MNTSENHFENVTLLEYLLNTLEFEESLNVSDHILNCKECEQRVKKMSFFITPLFNIDSFDDVVTEINKQNLIQFLAGEGDVDWRRQVLATLAIKGVEKLEQISYEDVKEYRSLSLFKIIQSIWAENDFVKKIQQLINDFPLKSVLNIESFQGFVPLQPRFVAKGANGDPVAYSEVRDNQNDYSIEFSSLGEISNIEVTSYRQDLTNGFILLEFMEGDELRHRIPLILIDQHAKFQFPSSEWEKIRPDHHAITLKISSVSIMDIMQDENLELFLNSLVALVQHPKPSARKHVLEMLSLLPHQRVDQWIDMMCGDEEHEISERANALKNIRGENG